jgi:hypothetical protein
MAGNFIPQTIAKNLEVLDLPDCVHLTDNFKCEILKVNECMGRECSFMLNQKQKSKSYNLWKKKMNELSESKQKDIAHTYFNGKMPWKS